MDKASYKEILSDSFNETSKLKDIIKTIKTMVHDEPNNMQLGKKIRSYFFDEEAYIYESPDGGTTIYRRRFGEHDGVREKI